MDLHPVALARMYSGLTQTALGQRIGKTQPQVARFESREADFSPYMQIIAEVTGLPLSFFDPARCWVQPESNISYRKRGNCPAGIKNRATFIASVANACVEPLVSNYVRYPKVDLPHIPAETVSQVGDEANSIAAARRLGAAAARSVREQWGVGWGPITDVIRLIESKGVRLFFVRDPIESLDGFACWIQEKPYMFINSYIADPARARFDVAHELGHLVMHRELELDKNVDWCEAMAHGFAAEFLAPWETFRREAGVRTDLDSLFSLRRRWRISMQAIVRHMYANGAISQGSYTSAFKRFSYLGYRRGPEPGWIVPDMSLIHATFWDQISMKGLHRDTLSESAGLPQKQLEEMLPMSNTLYQL